jgi:hypothetical protein
MNLEQLPENTEPIRPGNPETGAPFWNGCSPKFIYPPAFDFEEQWMAKQYRFQIWAADGSIRTFFADKPWAPLTPVWKDLPVGRTVVLCEGINAENVVCITNEPRLFWRDAPFTGDHPPKARPYADAARLAYDFILSWPPFTKFLETGEPDRDYDKNGYPSKTHAATIQAMATCADRMPGCRDKALRLARLAGEFLIRTACAPGTPLEHWPLTYTTAHGQACQHPECEGTIMLIYPFDVGMAFLDLAEATGERRWIDAAERIAATAMRTRREDGSWPLVLDIATGRPTTPNTLVPDRPMLFFEALARATGNDAYEQTARDCFTQIETGILKDWAWEGQFEDVQPGRKYTNLTKHSACNVMSYLLRRFPGDARYLAIARDIIRFAEDQFVFWELPYRPEDATCVFPRFKSGSGGRGANFHVPCCVEQFDCFNPVDASAAKLVRSWIDYGKAAHDGRALAKARAMADSMTRIQMPNGFIPTWWWAKAPWWNGGRTGLDNDPWINCHIASANTLAAAAESLGD